MRISLTGRPTSASRRAAALCRAAGTNLQRVASSSRHPANSRSISASAGGTCFHRRRGGIDVRRSGAGETLRGDGGGVFDLDAHRTITLSVTRVTTTGPRAAEVTDALAGRTPAATVLADLPASSRAALSRMADFFNTPARQAPA